MFTGKSKIMMVAEYKEVRVLKPGDHEWNVTRLMKDHGVDIQLVSLTSFGPVLTGEQGMEERAEVLGRKIVRHAKNDLSSIGAIILILPISDISSIYTQSEVEQCVIKVLDFLHCLFMNLKQKIPIVLGGFSIKRGFSKECHLAYTELVKRLSSPSYISFFDLTSPPFANAAQAWFKDTASLKWQAVVILGSILAAKEAIKVKAQRSGYAV
jgi:hypothetical protein